jgi:hypothetical protein
MQDGAHLRELQDKRSSLLAFLEPLENEHPVGGDTPLKRVRMRFLRREIAELDEIIAHEQNHAG